MRKTFTVSIPLAASFLLLVFILVANRAAADPTGLVAAYGFDEGSGTTVADSSGLNHIGTISGASWATGKNGGGLSFDGINDWVTIADANDLDLTSAMTLEAWVNLTANTSWRAVVYKERDVYYLYASTNGNTPGVGAKIGGYRENLGPSQLATGSWIHLAGTYDGITERLYVNGVQVSSRAQTGSIEVGSGPLRLGGNATFGEYFGGLMDDVRVYNRALTPAEIQTDMNVPVAASTSSTGQLGNTTVAGAVDSGDSNFINAVRFTMPNVAGTATGMSVYIGSPVGTAPNNQFSAAIYADAQGVPGARVANTVNGTIAPNAWNTLPISALLAPNATYWLGYNTNGTTPSQNNIYVTPGQANQLVWVAQTFGSWPETFGTLAGSSNYSASIYVSYAPGSAPPPTCSPAWSCSGFGACTNGTQTQTCTDTNNCGVTTNRPALSQTCTVTPPPTCTPNWQCGANWSVCTNNLQTRTCTDTNTCGTTANKPAESQSCSSTVSPGNEPATLQTAHDTIPNFCQNPTIWSAKSGNWSDTTVWDKGRVPGANDIVMVASGYTVTYDVVSDAALHCVGMRGTLVFRTNGDTRLKATHILALPGGRLQVGSQSSPIPASVKAEIIINDVALDTARDPDQFGNGLLSIDGTVTMHGSVKTPTFVRLARAPRAGDTTFLAGQATGGWQAGDTLVLPDSRQIVNTNNDRTTYTQLETRTVQSISADGKTITFSPALQYDHPGTTDENGDGQPDYIPHVANVTRNILVRSERRTGTRGHVFFTGRSVIDVRYAGFEGLGRTTFDDLNSATNHIGRYSLHAHHLYGPYPTIDPQYQYRLVGNSIYEDSATTPPQKWGITVHGSHYGLIQDNVVYNIGGAGIVTENGSESFNVFDHNFVARVSSNGGRLEYQESTRGIAREGVGFWFRGVNNYVRNNVVANMGEKAGDVEASYAFKYNMYYAGNLNIPNFRGANTSVSGEYTTRSGNNMPILEFSGNEMYGNIQGLTIWWLCSIDYDFQEGCGQSVFRDTVIWHTSRYAYYGYPAYNYVFDNLKVYGSPAVINDIYNSIWWYGDYGTKDHILRNSSFYNNSSVYTPYFRDGIVRFENNFFKTANGVVHRTSAAPGSAPGANLPDPNSVLVNNRYVAPAGRALQSVSMDFYTAGQDINNLDRLISCNHNGVTGDNFEVFFPEKNNAPCTTTRADIANGYVCATTLSASICGSTPPPVCTPAWSCSGFGACINGTQTQTCTDTNNCGVTTSRPILTQSCTTTPPPSTKFIIGDRVRVTADTGNLNVRATPSLSATLLGQQVFGALGTITAGPTAADGTAWWQVNYDTGADGWSIEDYLEKTRVLKNGDLIKLATDPKVYLIENNQRRWIVDSYTFRTLGYADSQIIIVTQAELNQFPAGSDLQFTCTPTWQCSGFGACTGDTQTQTCTDTNNCGVATGRPPLSQNCTTSSPPTSPLSISAFERQFAFRMPAMTAYASGVMAPDPDRPNEFWMATFDSTNAGPKYEIAKFRMPATTSNSNTLASLPTATLIQGPVDVWPRITTNPNNNNTIGSMLAVKDPDDGSTKLIFGAYSYYDQTSAPEDAQRHVIAVVENPNDLANSPVRGFFPLDAAINRDIASGYLSLIPSNYQSKLGGDVMVGAQGAQTTLAPYMRCEGLQSYVFSLLDLLGSSASESRAIPTKRVLDHDLYTTTDETFNRYLLNDRYNYITAQKLGFLVPGTQTVAFIGNTGGFAAPIAPPDYANYCPANDLGYHESNSCWPIVYKGWQHNGYTGELAIGAGPGSTTNDYRPMVWFYNLNDFENIANGSLNQASVVPYAYGRMSEAQVPDAYFLRNVGGAFFDPTSALLYVSMQDADRTSITDASRPIVVAFRINTSAPTCTPAWSCSGFGACTNGTQAQTCTDLNSCGTTTSRPPLSQTCTTGGGATVTGLQVAHRKGQSFVTFTEVADPAATYRVYRSTSLISSVTNLPPIAALPQDSGRNKYTNTNFIITDLGSPIADSTGLLVWTTAQSGTYYYAVTTSANASIVAGANASAAVAETVAAVPGAVQIKPTYNQNGAGTNQVYEYFAWEDYATWEHANWPYYGHRYDVVTPASFQAGRTYPLILALHSADGGYREPINTLAGDVAVGVYVLPRDNNFWFEVDPYTGKNFINTTFWYGYKRSDGIVLNNTEERVIRYTMLTRDEAKHQVDPTRIYVTGASLGGGGSMHLAYHYPTFFAGAFSSVGWVDPSAGLNGAGAPYAGFNTENGVSWNNWVDQVWLAANRSPIGPPIIHTFRKDDGTLGMSQYPPLLTQTEAGKNAHISRWQNGGHAQFSISGNASYLRYKTNEAYPAIANSSNSTPVTAQEGQRNLDLDWSSGLNDLFVGTTADAITDTPTAFGMTFRSLSAADATAQVTIRNTQQFRVSPNTSVRWESRAHVGGALLASGTVAADVNGLATVPLTITTAGNRLSLSLITTPPTVAITSPTAGQNIAGTLVTATFITSGDRTQADHLHVQLDNLPEVRGVAFDGSYTFTSVAFGNHTVRVYLARADHAALTNTGALATVAFSTQATPARTLKNGDLIKLATDPRVYLIENNTRRWFVDSYTFSTLGYVDSQIIIVTQTESDQFPLGANLQLTCTPVWQCSGFGTCTNGIQTQTCAETNNCGAGTSKPVESRSCTVTPPPATSVFCQSLPAATGNITVVAPSQAAQLPGIVSAVATGATIVLQDGTYSVSGRLNFARPGVTLRSQSGNRDAVILDASYNSADGEIISITASDVTIADVTLKKAWYHPVHITSGGQRAKLYNLHIIDGREQFVKVNGGNNDSGELACSLLEMTDAGRTFLQGNPVPGYQCYTGGLDAHQVKGWVVRNNTIKNIYCTNGGLAEHAIHFWNGGENPLIERNVLINNARGIGLGLLGSGITGGTVRNNFIYSDIAYYDSGIGIEDTPNALILHNTVFATRGTFNAPVDIRGLLAGNSTIARNNLHEPAISVRNGATPTLSNNVRANAGMFANPVAGDLHLLVGASAAINKGTNVGITHDIDGEIRDGQPDVGADEYGASIPPPACTPAWQCSGFGACTNGTQTQTCTDNNNCGVTTNKPTESQNCAPTPPSGGGAGGVVFRPHVEGRSSVTGLTFNLRFLDPTSLAELVQFSAIPATTLQPPQTVALAARAYIVVVSAPGYLKRKTNLTLVANATFDLPELPAGDFNGDNFVNSLDWSSVNTRWFSTDATADFNGDGVVNSLDFSSLNRNWNRQGE